MPCRKVNTQGSSDTRFSESEQPETILGLNDILDWLPPNTETLFVTIGPYALQASAGKEEENPPLEQSLELYSYGWLANIEEGAYLQAVKGCKLALSVEGARCFHPPKCLGMWLYEGCHFLVFESGFAPPQEALRKALLTHGAKHEEIAGEVVFSFEKMFEADQWTLFFCQPEPNLILHATNKGYLEEVLQRRQETTKVRAFPESLPARKYVDREASFWAIRQAHREDSPDLLAFALVFSFHPVGRSPDAATPRVIYLFKEENARDEIEQLWTYNGEATWKPTVTQTAPGVIELTAEFQQEGDASRFLFLLLCHLGHVICC
jgi:hypothetical protein